VLVEEFNIAQGLYVFEFDTFETELHSHPSIEIIIAKVGSFTLLTDTRTYTDVKFAIIPANQKHKLSSANCQLKIIMIEHHKQLVAHYFSLVRIDTSNDFVLQSEPEREVVQTEKLLEVIRSGQALKEYDERIAKTIEYLNQNELAYDAMIKTLRTITHLSESRLSHLFKLNVGISLKQYLIWSKLKSTIKKHLNSKEDLFSALIKSGFYDQAHFSKNFKRMLGVKPSKAYNSRSVQVLFRLGQ